MWNPFRRTQLVTVNVLPKGVTVLGLGTAYPSVTNNTDDVVRITWTAPPNGVLRSVDIQPRERHLFHVRDGKLRADFIEVV